MKVPFLTIGSLVFAHPDPTNMLSVSAFTGRRSLHAHKLALKVRAPKNISVAKETLDTFQLDKSLVKLVARAN
jgi:hypothetical protein